MAKKKSKNSAAKTQQNKTNPVEKIQPAETDVEPVIENNDDITEVSIDSQEQSEAAETNDNAVNLAGDSAIKEQINGLEKEITELKAQLSQKDSQLENVSKEKDLEIEKLNTTIETLNSKANEPVAQDSTSNEDIEELKKQLTLKTEESNKHKENYDKILSRVSQMKTIFGKMKESETKYELLESENAELKSKLGISDSKLSQIETTLGELNSECDKLTDMNTELKKQVESQNFQLENDTKSLEDENKRLKREVKETKSDLEEYLILIQEEKMSKTNLNQEINDLKIKLENIQSEKSSSDNKCNELKTEITKLNESIVQLKNDNGNIVSGVKEQLENKVQQLNQFTEEINDLRNLMSEKDMKLKTIDELEKSLKEKQLLIGKLRHETITLNEHLTKAMKLIKKESGKEMVDRELVSNLFISFLQIPRGDTKKFEVLQLLANFLDWDDDKKRHAGLISSGNYRSKSNSVVEVPHPSPSGTQSFVSLWTEFLEKESTPQDGGVTR